MVYSTPYVFETKVIYINRTPKYDKKEQLQRKRQKNLVHARIHLNI